MVDNSQNVGVEKLDKDKYQLWKFKMTNYLMGKGFGGYVVGEDAGLELLLQGVTPNLSQSLENMEQKRQESDALHITKCFKWYDWPHERIDYIKGHLKKHQRGFIYLTQIPKKFS